MDQELTASKIMDLVKKSFPDLTIERITINNRGWDNLVAIVNESVVFRFPKTKEAENAMKREIRLISMLKDFPVPVPEYRYFPKAGSHFAGYPMIPGVPLNEASTIGRGMWKDIVAAINYMRNFQKDSARRAGIPIYDAASWFKMQGDILALFKESLSEITRKGFFDELQSDLNVSLSGMKEDCFSLIHGDMYRGNVLISRRHDRLNGIIDWGDASYGDYAFDIAAVTMDFAPEYRKELVRQLSPEDDFTSLKRISFYRTVEPLYLADNLIRKGHAAEAMTIIKEVYKICGKTEH